MKMMLEALDQVEMAKQFYQHLYLSTNDIGYLVLGQDFYKALLEMRSIYE